MSSATPQSFGQFCRPAAWSLPVATIWCTGLTRPKAPVCGPLPSRGSSRENTLPARTSDADSRIFSGVMKLSVPTSSSSPQRPQLLKRVQYSSSNSLVSTLRAMVMGLLLLC